MVKVPRNRPEGPEGWGSGIAVLFLDLGDRRGGWSAPRSGRFTPGKTRYPLYRRVGGPQGRSGRVRKISPPPVICLFVQVIYYTKPSNTYTWE
jgi:hypothetical protein